MTIIKLPSPDWVLYCPFTGQQLLGSGAGNEVPTELGWWNSLDLEDMFKFRDPNLDKAWRGFLKSDGYAILHRERYDSTEVIKIFIEHHSGLAHKELFLFESDMQQCGTQYSLLDPNLA